MKRCPNCQKEFPDSMRFCQSDGTPLIEAVEETRAEDPLKTTVMRQDEIASAIPPASDPYKTVVAGSSEFKIDEEDDLLQLPDEIDPMKTMVVPPLVGQNKPKDILNSEPPKFDDIKEEIKLETPSSSPFSDYSSSNASSNAGDSPFSQPAEPPKFNEPSLSPPSFGDLSSNKDEDVPATVFQSSNDAGNAPKSDENAFSNDPLYGGQSEPPIPSPFDKPPTGFNEPPPPKDEQMFGSAQSNFNEPPSPFGQQSSPFDAPPSQFDPPKTSFQEPEAPFGGAQQQFNQMNEPSFNQPLQQSDWTPPPAPGSGWQDQGLGAQTPFQPPVGVEGQNQTLAIVSLVLGILSIVLCAGLTGPPALITGIMARKKVQQNPTEYGGSGLALGGIITGIIGTLLLLLVIAYIVFVFILAASLASMG